MIRSILKQLVCYCLLCYAHIVGGEIYRAQMYEPLKVKISKSGLNRISNPPYKITQVTGDDGKFRLKYDEDGSNIYLMPLGGVGERIEISIKNNAGTVQDLELSVADIKGKSIVIDGFSYRKAEYTKKKDLALMLRAMKDNVNGKFYVRATGRILKDIGILQVEQKKVYQYKDLVGGVFEISNPGKDRVTFDVAVFAKAFDNVISSYPDVTVIEPKETIIVLIVQKLAQE